MLISVKHKLLALFSCILTGFFLIFAVDFLEGRRTKHILELERLAIATQLETLNMRRQEKNFFLRHDPASLTAVRQHQKAAIASIETIRSRDPSHDPLCDATLGLLREYLAGFEAMAGASDATGINDPATLFLERSQALEQLGTVDPELSRGLARLPRLEKRWLASGPPESLKRLKNETQLLLGSARLGRNGENVAAAKALSEYQAALHAYADRLEEAGSGSAAFVAAARILEPKIEALRTHYEERRRHIAATAALAEIGIQAFVIALVALAAWAVFRSVATPLAVLSRHAGRVAEGEATNLEPTEFSGEFRALAEDIGRMEKHLVATISDLRRKEQEAADEAHHAKEARQRAEDLSRVKSNFLNLVSHELKTPLTSMVGFAQVMLKRLDRSLFAELAANKPEMAAECARFHDNLSIMLGEGRRLAGLIDSVLELAALESGDTPLAMGAVPVAEVVDLAVEPFLETLSEKNLQFLRDIPKDLPPLFCDRERMVYVLRHLFSNAVKFTDSGYIACRAYREGDMAVICVEDTGRGIPLELREAVFEKFLQLGDTTTGKMPGLGIGLAASRAVVECHGGSIRIAGEPGRGSTVSVTVPLAKAV
ncbi:MAG: ATP-binding protein [Solidesulfovibrio sp.]